MALWLWYTSKKPTHRFKHTPIVETLSRSAALGTNNDRDWSTQWGLQPPILQSSNSKAWDEGYDGPDWKINKPHFCMHFIAPLLWTFFANIKSTISNFAECKQKSFCSDNLKSQNLQAWSKQAARGSVTAKMLWWQHFFWWRQPSSSSSCLVGVVWNHEAPAAPYVKIQWKYK